MELLLKLFIKKGTTFVLVSHDEGTRDYIGKTIYLEDGKIINSKLSKEESH